MRMVVVLLLGSPLAAMGCSGTTATKGAPPEAEAPSAGAAPSVPEQPPTPAAPPPSAVPEFWQYMPDLTVFHGYQQGLRWRFGRAGIELEAATIENVSVDDKVIRTVWETYGAMIDQWSTHYGVPFELIMTAICVESRGNPNARNANNIGLMQILVSTAQSALDDETITADSLRDPKISIRAGTAYMALQRRSTHYDPPKVAAAYNAGRLRAADNRWGMKQYGIHIDKTVVWFNAVLAFVAEQDEVPRVSFADYLRRHLVS